MTDIIDANGVTTFGDPIYQGEGKWIKIVFTKNGVALDISNATFAFVVKQALSDVNPLYQALLAAIDVSEAQAGIVRINLPSSATLALAPGVYWGELTTTLIALTDVNKKQIKFKIKLAAVTT